jgi:hypothetical protein
VDKTEVMDYYNLPGKERFQQLSFIIIAVFVKSLSFRTCQLGLNLIAKPVGFNIGGARSPRDFSAFRHQLGPFS